MSGIALPMPKAQYPPAFRDKSRLEYYASLFNSVEVNSIFYKLPRPSTVSRWRDSVPDDFRFTFKVSKTITHAKGLHFRQEDVSAFVNTVAEIGEKRGCLLAQLPPSLKVDSLNELQTFLESLCEATRDAWRIALEFRHASWYEREVYELLADYNVAMVMHDMAASATPPSPVTGRFVYLRFHGPEPRYGGDYADEVLRTHAARIKSWLKEGKTVFAYFNNTMGNGVNNLQTLNRFVLRTLRGCS